MDPDCFSPANQQRSLNGWTVLALGGLGVPRVILHDLDIISGPNPLAAVLALGPPVIWTWYAVSRRVSEPLRMLLSVGLLYGAMLALTHQILWTRAFDDVSPRLGGELEGKLSGGVESLVLRTFAVSSSLMVGLAVGAASGLVARALLRRDS